MLAVASENNDDRRHAE